MHSPVHFESIVEASATPPGFSLCSLLRHALSYIVLSVRCVRLGHYMIHFPEISGAQASYSLVHNITRVPRRGY